MKNKQIELKKVVEWKWKKPDWKTMFWLTMVLFYMYMWMAIFFPGWMNIIYCHTLLILAYIVHGKYPYWRKVNYIGRIKK